METLKTMLIMLAFALAVSGILVLLAYVTPFCWKCSVKFVRGKISELKEAIYNTFFKGPAERKFYKQSIKFMNGK